MTFLSSFIPRTGQFYVNLNREDWDKIYADLLRYNTFIGPPVQLEIAPLTGTPVKGQLEYDGSNLYFTPHQLRKRVMLANDTLISDVTVVNTLTETTIYSATAGFNSFDIGDVINMKLFGVFSTKNNAVYFTIRIKFDGTTVATIVSPSDNVTNAGLFIDINTTIRTLGTSGTCSTYSMIDLNATKGTDYSSNTTINTTVSNTFVVTIQWNDADINNSVTIQQGYTQYF